MDAPALTIGLDAQAEQRPAALPLLPRLFRWSIIVGEFGAAQVAVQAVGVLAGLIIVRSLAKPEYALYAIATAGITMFNMLADLGVSVALRSIGGEVHDDRTKFSQLVATVRQLRTMLAVFAVSVSLPVTAWMLLSNGATSGKTIALCVVAFVASVPLLMTLICRETSLILGKYRKVQRVDVAGAGVRLAGVAVAFTHLSAFVTTAVTAIANWIQWQLYRQRAADDVDLWAPADEEFRRRVLGVTYRVMPNSLFYCLQGQITYVLLTLSGTATGVADVAALGRIAALLSIFGVVFNNVLSPRFARCQDAKRLRGLYFGLLSATVAVLVPVVVLAWLFPRGFLWILGDAYRGLEYEMSLMAAAACMHLISGVMISLNYGRNWLRWYSFLNVPSILAVQVACIALLDVGTVRGVLWFSIVSAVAPIPVYVADTLYGLRTPAMLKG